MANQEKIVNNDLNVVATRNELDIIEPIALPTVYLTPEDMNRDVLPRYAVKRIADHVLQELVKRGIDLNEILISGFSMMHEAMKDQEKDHRSDRYEEIIYDELGSLASADFHSFEDEDMFERYLARLHKKKEERDLEASRNGGRFCIEMATAAKLGHQEQDYLALSYEVIPNEFMTDIPGGELVVYDRKKITDELNIFGMAEVYFDDPDDFTDAILCVIQSPEIKCITEHPLFTKDDRLVLAESLMNDIKILREHTKKLKDEAVYSALDTLTHACNQMMIDRLNREIAEKQYALDFYLNDIEGLDVEYED